MLHVLILFWKLWKYEDHTKEVKLEELVERQPHWRSTLKTTIICS